MSIAMRDSTANAGAHRRAWDRIAAAVRWTGPTILLAVPILATALILGAIAAPLGAQQGDQQGDQQEERTQDPPRAVGADTLQLVFEREIFTYPSHARRNPFRPLTTQDAGPRFENLALLGIISSPDLNGSIALIGIRGGTGAGAGQGGVAAVTHRLREGQVIGNVRIIEIRPREVVVEVEDFGLRERRIMEIVRTAPEARDAPGSDPPPAQGDTTTPPPDTVPPPGGSGGGNAGAGGSGTGTGGSAGSNGTGDI